MPQSLAQVYLHTIFSTKDRIPAFADSNLLNELHAYLAGICNRLECPAVKVGGVTDHVHLLTKLPRTLTIAEFVKETKRVSSVWLQDHGEIWKKFQWQAGYGTFSVSVSNVPQV